MCGEKTKKRERDQNDANAFPNVILLRENDAFNLTHQLLTVCRFSLLVIGNANSFKDQFNHFIDHNIDDKFNL